MQIQQTAEKEPEYFVGAAIRIRACILKDNFDADEESLTRHKIEQKKLTYQIWDFLLQLKANLVSCPP